MLLGADTRTTQQRLRDSYIRLPYKFPKVLYNFGEDALQRQSRYEAKWYKPSYDDGYRPIRDG